MSYKSSNTGKSWKKSSFSGPSQSSYRRQPKRTEKKFDPSLFIKRVEEQQVAQLYVPKNAFADFSIENQLKMNILEKGYTIPTPIQDQVIPHLLEGRDIVGTANTGTGKTAAFLIPLINNILTKKRTRVLIITPTRELACQIQQEFTMFASKTGIKSVVCIGGLSLHNQIKALRANPQFVIGTPGRLLDLEKNMSMDFRKFDSIVLDEVDTMLDMGFINDIRTIAQKLPSNRHSLFFQLRYLKPSLR